MLCLGIQYSCVLSVFLLTLSISEFYSTQLYINYTESMFRIITSCAHTYSPIIYTSVTINFLGELSNVVSSMKPHTKQETNFRPSNLSITRPERDTSSLYILQFITCIHHHHHHQQQQQQQQLQQQFVPTVLLAASRQANTFPKLYVKNCAWTDFKRNYAF